VPVLAEAFLLAAARKRMALVSRAIHAAKEMIDLLSLAVSAAVFAMRISQPGRQAGPKTAPQGIGNIDSAPGKITTPHDPDREELASGRCGSFRQSCPTRPAKRVARPRMAPQSLENIESTPGWPRLPTRSCMAARRSLPNGGRSASLSMRQLLAPKRLKRLVRCQICAAALKAPRRNPRRLAIPA